MPKEVRTSSGSQQHKPRVQPYPSRPLPSTTTPTSNHRPLPSSSSSAATVATLAHTSIDRYSKMDPMVSSPPTHTSLPELHSTGFTMTSPGTERASTAWTEEDDGRLMVLRSKNMNWIAIAQNFPNKTGNACRKRHERLVEKRNAQGWDSVRLSDLATAYMDCRETMWRMVAERCGGEKWQTIEQKCMEKGFKTLSSAARASRRHQPALSVHHSHPGYPIEGSPEHQMLDDGSFRENFRDSGFYEPIPKGPSDSYNYHFGSQPGSESSLVFCNPSQTTAHSRRASAAHSIGPYSVDHHSSRSNSHGPASTMAPPAAANPFASPQPYFPDPSMTSMPPTLSSHSPAPYPGSRSLQAGHQVLPSISNGAFDPPSMQTRLPSIIGTPS